MATVNNGCLPLLLLLLLLLLLSLLCVEPVYAVKKSYVVYMGGHSHSREESNLLRNQERAADAHYEFLGSFLGRERAQDAIFYSYTRHINGFAANLEEEDAMEIAKHPEVISVFPNRGRKLHTTHSWSFLGLERNGHVPKHSLWKKARFGQDAIIGNLDTGVWPESASFRDEGMGPVPSKWRGICQVGEDDKFKCNRKLIGARFLKNGHKSAVSNRTLKVGANSPRDDDGHGTHTLSTAGGRFVPGANIFGFGNGTAKGGSPEARVAAYKVCFPSGNGNTCLDADVLAAFDAAISDGVDVLSVSLGGKPLPYFNDSVAIGSFHAVKNGVVVVCSAGNSGPEPKTVSNLAPWIITVGASTTDREFSSYASLGNGKKLKGRSLSPRKIPKKKLYPLINSTDARLENTTRRDAQLCMEGSLDPTKVKGKIVACLRGIIARVKKGEVVRQAGGLGMILANDVSNGNQTDADAHVLPATHVSYTDGLSLFSYINSTTSPRAYIVPPKTVLNTKPAPLMAAFSSRGPNTINPEFIKPDITAPGVSIIAAFTEARGPTDLPFDSRRVRFNSESGTSMSCPHIAGIVGLLKTMYPDWSPSAIKSAIMTTARSQDNTKMPIRNSSFVKATPFNYGSGHVWPNRAMDPGLVYDVTIEDYLNFLCNLGYNSSTIAKFSGKRPFTCPSALPKNTDLNYPSIAIPDLSGNVTVTRRLKNVGSPGAYTVRVVPPSKVSVVVEPDRLVFDRVGEEKSFKVRFTAKGRIRDYVFGRMIWSDGVHHVRSPLVVKTA